MLGRSRSGQEFDTTRSLMRWVTTVRTISSFERQEHMGTISFLCQRIPFTRCGGFVGVEWSGVEGPNMLWFWWLSATIASHSECWAEDLKSDSWGARSFDTL